MKIEIDDNKKWQQSLTIKIILLAILGLFLLAPLEMIKSVIREREKSSENVKKEIAFQWAGQQTVSGPLLNIPVVVHQSEKNAEPHRIIYHIMPENLEITGNILTEKRHRAIYQAIVYTGDITLTGEFVLKAPAVQPDDEILWNEAYFSVGITDNRGIKGSVALKAGSAEINAVPGLRDTEVFSSGITFPYGLNEKDSKIPFSIALKLSGSESLNFIPSGRMTKVKLNSPWDYPGFSGNFLPSERIVDRTGFRAEWLITDLNRNFPQEWAGSAYTPDKDAFGVNFIFPVDHYQKALRSAKYGILFIALTFLSLIFSEMTTGIRFHVFHYLLISLALVLFFSLLNALSEQIGFNMSYLISSVSVAGLTGLFLGRLVKNIKPVLITVGLLVFLYTFIFILLTLNEYAYLAGNIGLFVLLAVTMALSVRLKQFTP